MKRFLLTALALFASLTIFAQNDIDIINEDFSSADKPDGWYAAGNGINNWWISPSFGAGGKPNELQLNWSPQFNGISRFVSPAVDLSEVTSAILAFDHYPAMYYGSAKIGVATSSDNGTTWNSVWSETYDKTEKHSILETISGPDMGKENVRFCIYYEGNSSAINSWYFDNFRVYTVEDLNIEMVSIDMPSLIKNGNNEITFSVKNSGKTTIKSFEARCIVNGNEELSETFYTEVASMENKQVTYEDMFNFSHDKNYSIEIEIFRVNDGEDDNSDNNSTKDIIVAMADTQRTPMIEHFSSSTCAPCVNVNFGMSMLTDNNPGKYTYTKYAMNWPGTGDPYFTTECETKRFYYNVSGAPELYLDGTKYGNNYISNDFFKERYEVPAYANVRGAFQVEGNTIKVIADFMTYFKAENIKAYVSVNEKTTTGNVGTNGESEFHHMMMKMLNSVDGTTLNIEAGEYKRLEFSYDMSQTFMEDINDLEVSLWLQNDETKEIYNSHFAYGYSEHCYPARNVKTYIQNGNLTVRWDAPEKGAPAGYNVYIDSKLVAENISALEYSTELKNSQVVEVVAAYEDKKTSIGAVKVISAESNVDDVNTKVFNIFPNPAKDYVKIAGENIKSVSVYNCIGALVERFEIGNDNATINTSNYNTGIYFITIEDSLGNNSTQKLVVTK